MNNDYRDEDDRFRMMQNEYDRHAYRNGMIAGTVLGIAIMLFLIIGTNFLLGKIYRGKSSDEVITDKTSVTDKIGVIAEYLDKYYFEDIDEETLTNGIYYGMTAVLGDPYTGYYSPEDYKELTTSTTGEYCGIGVMVTKNSEDGTIVVSKVFKNSPAQGAGIQQGDVIYSVEGEIIEDMTTDQLAAKVLGEEGTDVTLEILREEEILSYTITRQKVEMDSVSYEMKEGNIGYIQIESFDSVTPKQVKEAIEELTSIGMKGIIVDLRDNPGGSLSSVVDIASMFEEGKKLFLYSETKEGEREDYYTTGKVLLKDLPMVILINENSASASEAFSGAMKCYERAKLVGTTSFGKGIMQTIYPLGDGSALKITTGKYYLPDGNNIHKIGITPDVEVEASGTEGEDAQLNKALELLR